MGEPYRRPGPLMHSKSSQSAPQKYQLKLIYCLEAFHFLLHMHALWCRTEDPWILHQIPQCSSPAPFFTGQVRARSGREKGEQSFRAVVIWFWQKIRGATAAEKHAGVGKLESWFRQQHMGRGRGCLGWQQDSSSALSMGSSSTLGADWCPSITAAVMLILPLVAAAFPLPPKNARNNQGVKAPSTKGVIRVWPLLPPGSQFSSPQTLCTSLLQYSVGLSHRRTLTRTSSASPPPTTPS